MTTVVDASALVAALVDPGSNGLWARSTLAKDSLAAPELALVEATDVLRRMEQRQRISHTEAISAHAGLLGMEIEMYPFTPFAERVWDLRSNLTSYDAWYVALAEALDCPLATLDLKLSRAYGPACQMVVPPLSQQA